MPKLTPVEHHEQPRTVLRCERAKGASRVYRAELRHEAWRRWQAAREPLLRQQYHSLPDRPGALQETPDGIFLITLYDIR